MKLQFIGRGGAFAPITIGNSNLLLTSDSGKRLVVDFGTTAPYILRDEMGIPFTDIDGIYISHLHGDHIGGVEQFAFSRHFVPRSDGKRPKLFAVPELYKELWNTSLKGGLDCLPGRIMSLTDYFDCQPVKKGRFVWEHYEFTVVPTVHVVSGYVIKQSYGLFIKPPPARSGQHVLFTSDTTFAPDLLGRYYAEATLILHDCETYPVRSSVHSNIADLRTLPADVKAKMWLYHYTTPVDVEGEFAGFVVKGQIFDI
jgi:ribonuclease BN (tRNA processing enzyme)